MYWSCHYTIDIPDVFGQLASYVNQILNVTLNMAAIELNDQIEPINIEQVRLYWPYCFQAVIFNTFSKLLCFVFAKKQKVLFLLNIDWFFYSMQVRRNRTIGI